MSLSSNLIGHAHSQVLFPDKYDRSASSDSAACRSEAWAAWAVWEWVDRTAEWADMGGRSEEEWADGDDRTVEWAWVDGDNCLEISSSSPAIVTCIISLSELCIQCVHEI